MSCIGIGVCEDGGAGEYDEKTQGEEVRLVRQEPRR